MVGPITSERLSGETKFTKRRDLSELDLDYLFLDGSHFRMHPGSPAEPVLAAWGIDVDGHPVFVGLAPAAAESTDAWEDFLADLKARGLRPPLLVVTHGALGLLGAIELHFSRSLHQRCVIHRLGNALAKVSKADQGEFKAAWWAVFDGIEAESGASALAEASRRAAAFQATWGRRHPAAVACLTEDLASLTTHLHFPSEHWRRVRHSNFIERTFGGSRRRVKVIG